MTEDRRGRGEGVVHPEMCSCFETTGLNRGQGHSSNSAFWEEDLIIDIESLLVQAIRAEHFNQDLKDSETLFFSVMFLANYQKIKSKYMLHKNSADKHAPQIAPISKGMR